MIDVVESLRRLASNGAFVAGVPCSGLAPLIAGWRSSHSWMHIPAVNEAEAVGLAAGASIRQRSFVYLQNSGLGYALDGVTSLVLPAALPVTLIVSHRGRDKNDALAQHVLSGRATIPIIEALGLTYATCYDSSQSAFDRAVSSLPTDRVSFLILGSDLEWRQPKGTALAQEPKGGVGLVASEKERMTVRKFRQAEVVSELLKRVDRQVIITSTGYLSRQVHAEGDRIRNFYLTGAMGLTSSFALGVDLVSQPRGGVVVIDGDGSALMHLGSLATVGSFGSARYKHVIIDNNAYGSTGGQPSAATGVSFPRVALAAGYRAAANAGEFRSLDQSLDWLFSVEGPVLLAVDTEIAAASIPRVTIDHATRARRLGRSLR